MLLLTLFYLSLRLCFDAELTIGGKLTTADGLYLKSRVPYMNYFVGNDDFLSVIGRTLPLDELCKSAFDLARLSLIMSWNGWRFLLN